MASNYSMYIPKNKHSICFYLEREFINYLVLCDKSSEGNNEMLYIPQVVGAIFAPADCNTFFFF